MGKRGRAGRANSKQALKEPANRDRYTKRKPKTATEEAQMIATDLAAELSAYVIRLEMESAQLRRDIRQVLGVGDPSPFLEEFRNNYQLMLAKKTEGREEQQYLEKENQETYISYKDRKQILDDMLYGRSPGKSSNKSKKK
ncbi:hypothetical protein [Okeania sp. SIO2B3]|uniref:hypothetical protein n=1 Tax=Okeania sp. SIO2B3 TaxID=2607784 RepID=UPI0013C108C3|nr:hypothetical protein [Okeania sp. SIO2B3]NET40577.1 hypothetical protein [Okeania sp. SIO2B3]